MTLSLVILGAGILATIAVVIVRLARHSAGPECPECHGREVTENGRLYSCELCGQRWRVETPKRFGTPGGKDLT